jgi:hypothetical protein
VCAIRFYVSRTEYCANQLAELRDRPFRIWKTAWERREERGCRCFGRADVQAGKPSALDDFLVDEDREPAFATWPATLAAAERDQLPL